MTATLSSVASILFASMILLTGTSLLGIIVPLRMDAAGFSDELIGVIMAGYFAGLLVGAIYGKSLIGRVGHIRAFAGFAAITTAVTLAYPLLPTALAWGLLRFLGGFCTAALFAVLESWLNERTENSTRGRVLSVYMMVNYCAIMIGQLTVNLWALEGHEGFMMAALLTALSLVPIVLTRIEAPSLEENQPLSMRALYDASPLAAVGSCVAGLVMGAYYGMGAVYAGDVGLSVFGVSVFMSSVIFGGMLLQWPIGRVSDRLDRRTVLLAILIAVAVVSAAVILQTLASGPAPILFGLAFLLGGTMTTIYPICIAQAFDYIPRSRYVAASSGLLLAYAVGATLGPVVASLFMGAVGAWGMFGFIGVTAFAFAGFVLYRMAARRALPLERQEPMVPMPRMSPVVGELDPRTAASAPGSAPVAAPEPETPWEPAAPPASAQGGR